MVHTEGGTEMLRNFVSLCADASLWSTKTFSQRTPLSSVLPSHCLFLPYVCITGIQDDVKAHIGNRNVFILVSGGVDSTVAYTLLQKVLDPSRVYGLLVDTGALLLSYSELSTQIHFACSN